MRENSVHEKMDKLSFSHKYMIYFKLMFWTKYLTQTNEILTQKNVKHSTIKENKFKTSEKKQLRAKA